LKQTNFEIELGDLVALESVRLFLPVVHGRLIALADDLTIANSNDDEARARIRDLIEVGARDAIVVRNLISKLFPIAEAFIGGPTYGTGFQQEWLEKRRVAHRDVFSLYRDQVFRGKLLADRQVSGILETLRSGHNVAEMLLVLPDVEKANLLYGLSYKLHGLGQDQLTELYVQLREKICEFSRESAGLLTVSPFSALNYLVGRLFAELISSGTQLGDLATTIANGPSLYSRVFSLAALEGLVEDDTLKLSGEIRDALSIARRQISMLPLEQFQSEGEVALILNFLRRENEVLHRVDELLTDDHVAARFISGHVGTGLQQSSGSRFAQRISMIDLEGLSSVFGGYEKLSRRITEILQNLDIRDEDLLQKIMFVANRLEDRTNSSR
jgi:hypothetical protein